MMMMKVLMTIMICQSKSVFIVLASLAGCMATCKPPIPTCEPPNPTSEPPNPACLPCVSAELLRATSAIGEVAYVGEPGVVVGGNSEGGIKIIGDSIIDIATSYNITGVAVTPNASYFTATQGLFRLEGQDSTGITNVFAALGPLGYSGIDFNPNDGYIYFGNRDSSSIERFSPSNPTVREDFFTTSSAPSEISIDLCEERIIYSNDAGDLQAVDLENPGPEDPLSNFPVSVQDFDILQDRIALLLINDGGIEQRFLNGTLIESLTVNGIQSLVFYCVD